MGMDPTFYPQMPAAALRPSEQILMGPPPAATQEFDADPWQRPDRRQARAKAGRRSGLGLGLLLLLLVGWQAFNEPAGRLLSQLPSVAALQPQLRHLVVRLSGLMQGLPARLLSESAVPAVSGRGALAAAPLTAEVLCAGNDPQAAADAFRLSLATDRAATAAQVGLGFCLLRLHDPQQASLLFAAVLQLGPDVAAAHLGMAQAFEALQKPRDAQRHLRQVLALVPEAPMAVEARQTLARMTR